MEIASIFNKETGKRHFLIFPGNGHKKGKKFHRKKESSIFKLPLKKLTDFELTE